MPRARVAPMTRDLSRLLRPQSVAVVGGGAWCAAVVGQLVKAGFGGAIWPVHPTAGEVGGRRAVAAMNDLPSAPDAAFVGVNRDATVAVVGQLAEMGAGGTVCFASGFAEVGDGAERNRALLAAAGEMPVLGPNCYGFINALDGALLWPDQHGCLPVDRGVAILTQSSNIAINLTMQARALPIAYIVTCGNQAQTSQAAVALALLDDARVTAIGLHIEGFGNLAEWQALARAATARGVPLVALKVGRSAEARAATVSHTASLAGADAGAGALLARLGILRAETLPVFLETLKLLHGTGRLEGRGIATISCSGGEASLSADMGQAAGLRFPALTEVQQTALFAALGQKVTLANPLDYHTYIWRDTAAMARAFGAMADPAVAITALIVDYPRADRCDPADWVCATEAALAARAATGRPLAMVATLPELMPEDVAATLSAGGVTPMNGLAEAFAAFALAATPVTPDAPDLLMPGADPVAPVTVGEAAAKAALAAHGLVVPASRRAGRGDLAAVAAGLKAPLALKAEGLAHKSEAGGVALGLDHADLDRAAAAMGAERFLVEEMVTGAVAELLVGVTRDAAHGFVLTLAAGGVLTEILEDSASLLLPVTAAMVDAALDSLRMAPLLVGYRGRPGADRAAIHAAVRAMEAYVVANAATVTEVEVNPLMCLPDGAIAVDALIRKAPR